MSLEDQEYLRMSQCGHNLVCCDLPSLNQPSSGNFMSQPGSCGIQEAERIFGGLTTQIDEYPWM
jgi:hypothetical protein